MCLCPPCDEKLESELAGKFLNDLCDCDMYMRWICNKCVSEGKSWTREYYDKCTVLEGGGVSKEVMDHQFTRDFYCVCSATVPQDTRPRCTWCKRRHLPEKEWHERYQRLRREVHPFDDPCYPHWERGSSGSFELPYSVYVLDRFGRVGGVKKFR